MYASNSNNKTVKTYNMIKQSIMFKNTPREDSRNLIKASLRSGSVNFPLQI